MKASSTTTIEIREKVIEFDIDLFQALALTCLISILSILLYKSFYLWSIVIILVSYGAFKIHGFYKELINCDLSVDISDFTMDDVMADLECDSYKFYNFDKNQTTQKVDSKALH